jgi:putative peptide zinc metalloprotease protein
VSLRPKLRQDLVLVEQSYRGEQSFIVKDPESRKYFRFRPVEIKVMLTLDGTRTAAEAAAELLQQGIKVSAAGVEGFAAKLAKMGLCERTLSERSVLQMERLRAERRKKLRPSLFQGELLRMRWSVGDPDEFFNRWLPRLGFFFSRSFLILSVALFAIYILILAIKWPEFTRSLADFYTLNVGLGTLVVFWVTGTVIIVIHELGHGFTCKYFGGQVHEIGAMLIYFEPAFFCNVNDAWTFPELKSRLWVTAAGSWIQLVIASLGAIVWWAATPGTLPSEVAFAAVLIGGFTTVLMNANPLIPLDGYYALSDYLEIPNLRQRALAYLGWLIKTRALRMDLPEPAADEREKRVFLIYGVLASVYISLILLFFAATSYGWLTRWLGAVGLLVFLGSMVMSLQRPVRQWGSTVWAALREKRSFWRQASIRRRLQAIGLGVVLLGAVVPWPITVSAPFRVVPALSIPLTAPDSGFVDQVLVREGTRTLAAAPLVRIRNLELEREAAESRRISDSLTIRLAQARAGGRTGEVAQLDLTKATEEAKVAGLRERIASLEIRAPSSAVVLTPRADELKGHWFSRGAVVLELGQPDSVELRIALSGPGAGYVQAGQSVDLLAESNLTDGVRGKLAEVSAVAGPGRSVEARLRLPADESWRPGVTGEASIRLRESNVWGALWWQARRLIRSDLFL